MILQCFRGGYDHQSSQHASRHTQRVVSHGLGADNKKPAYQLHIQVAALSELL